MELKIPEKFHAIDCHQHVATPFCQHAEKFDRQEAEAILAMGDRLGIEKFCISRPGSAPMITPEEVRIKNDIVLEAMKFSNRYIGFCFVNPGFSKEAVDEVNRCVRDNGMGGIKLYHQYLMNDPVQTTLLEHCEKLRCPVLMHSAKMDYPKNLSNASHMVDAARRFPGVDFIQGHIGGGGDWEWNLRVLEDAPSNLYIDTSGTVIDRGMVRRTVETLGAEHVLFGTDMISEDAVAKVLSAGFDDEVLQKVFHDNLAGLLKGRI